MTECIPRQTAGAATPGCGDLGETFSQSQKGGMDPIRKVPGLGSIYLFPFEDSDREGAPSAFPGMRYVLNVSRA